MSIEAVRAYFAPLGMADKILEFETSSATVELAAEAVGVESARIAKTLSFWVEDSPILLVTAGDAKVHSGSFKRLFHTKPKMLSFEEVHERIGHDVGGVCPFALPEDVRVYLDVSLQRFDTVFPAAGSSNSAIELTCPQLQNCAHHFTDWIDVCKNWREEAEH